MVPKVSEEAGDLAGRGQYAREVGLEVAGQAKASSRDDRHAELQTYVPAETSSRTDSQHCTPILQR